MFINRWEVRFGSASKDQILMSLSKGKIGINTYASMLFMSNKLQTSNAIKIAKVIDVSVKDLGLQGDAVFQDIVHSARTLGLQLCPWNCLPI